MCSEYISKVGIAGDFVANGNLFFPAQNRFLRRLMARAEQRCAILQNQNSMKQIQMFQWLISDYLLKQLQVHWFQ